MKLTVIPIVIYALGMAMKYLEKYWKLEVANDILLDSGIQTFRQIPDLVFIDKNKRPNLVDMAVPVDYRAK